MSDILKSSLAQFMPGAVGSLVQGGASLLGGYLNYKYNSWLTDKQNQFNLEMWNRTNEYNSPQAQMQRFKEAGLNPNLIYGQGNNGNASGSPQLVVPNAPDYTKGMQEMAKAFNIENLRTIVANRKKAQADADNARTNADRNAMDFDSDMVLGATYDYNPETGQFFRMPVEEFYKVRNLAASNFYTRRKLAENYRGAYLIPYRSALLEQQKNYLVPQVSMSQYESKYFPVNYWIGTGAKAAKGINDVVGIFNPLRKGFKSPSTTYHNTYKYYNF